MKKSIWTKVFLFSLAFAYWINIAVVSASSTNESKAVYVHQPPKIDGLLNEPAWQTTVPISNFIQRQPDTGAPVSEQTLVYILYDKDNLYIGFHCADDPSRITSKELARDVSLGEDDRVQIILDTFHDRRNAYWFQIGPRGSIGDALVSENGAAFNKQWDGLWDGRAKINDKGWDAELIIPFKTLNFKPGQTTWGLKLIRHIRRRLESSYWPEANLNSYKFQVSDEGELNGLEGITKGIGLDIRPYALIGTDYHQDSDNKLVWNIGGDAFYRITPGIKAALTINTDFAQTEVDSRQINLTRFSLLFPEKRGFFLDGANYFNFGFGGDDGNNYGQRNIPFFSRRIGLDADGNPIPLIWGLKTTGQTGKWSLGFQQLMDHPDTVFRNFTVARVKRNIGEQSYIGFIGTRGDAIGEADNYLMGLDLRLATAKFKGDKNLAFTAFGLKSKTEGLENKDYAFGTEINYPNDFFFFRLGHQEIGDNYRAGIGFVPRLGIKESYVESGIGPRPGKYGILQIKVKGDYDYITNMNNELLTRIGGITPMEIEFKSGDLLSFKSKSTHEYLENDFEIFPRDSITIAQGTYDFWRHAITAQSALRRNFWVMTKWEWGDFYDGNRGDLIMGLGYKIIVPLFVGLQYEQSNVSLVSGDFQTKIYRFNADILFSPTITLTNFIQYDNVTEKLGWQSRFRWILQPGNEILLVWNSSMLHTIDSDRMIMAESTTRFKINYNFRF